MNESGKGRVYVVDDDSDDRFLAERVVRTLGYDAICFPDGAPFLAHVRAEPGGCALLDMRMPQVDGLGVLRALQAEKLGIGVIVMTAYGELEAAVEAMKLGAVDFIAKPYAAERVGPALEACLSAQARRQAAELDVHAAQQRLALLSPREREVLDQLLEGHPTKVIAYHLGVSPRTVEVFRSKLMTKLEVRSLAAAIRIALRAKEEV